MSLLTADEARVLVASALQRRGLELDASGVVADHLVRAELRGYPSHGLVRLGALVKAIAKTQSRRPPSVSVDLPGFIKVDGGNSLGIVAVHEGLRRAADRTRDSGATVVAITDYVGTTGCLGVYGADLATRSIVSILLCNSEFAVAPYGSRRAVLGTNPLALTFPTDPFPVVADLATAAWSYGSLKAAMVAGKAVPQGIVQTEDGRPSTDPNDADNGSQLPMAEHKGFALGLAIELLCGPLIGGKAGRDAVPGSDGFLAVLVRLDAARPSTTVVKEALSLVDEVKRGPLAQGFKEIRIPGERAQKAEETTSSIVVQDDVLAFLRETP